MPDPEHETIEPDDYVDPDEFPDGDELDSIAAQAELDD